jgi:hypothetical protein
MKKAFFAARVLVLFALCGLCAVSAFSQSGAVGIDDAELNRLVKEYLEKTFNKYLKRGDLSVSDVSCATDWNASSADETLNYYTVRAKFRNFPLDRQILSGRLETSLAVRKNSGAVSVLGKKAVIRDDDQKQLHITLFVNDELSDELRESLITGHIRKNHENPLDIHIYKEQTEIYANSVYASVSAVVNNDKIVYMRTIFEKQPVKTTKYGIFTVQETPWQINRSEEIFSRPFPNISAFKKDIQKDVFEPMRGHYFKTVGNGNINEGGSKIESITKTELLEANNGMIKLALEAVYELDLWGFVGSYKRYAVPLVVFYTFDFEKREWEYKGIEEIKTDTVTAIK